MEFRVLPPLFQFYLLTYLFIYYLNAGNYSNSLTLIYLILNTILASFFPTGKISGFIIYYNTSVLIKYRSITLAVSNAN